MSQPLIIKSLTVAIEAGHYKDATPSPTTLPLTPLANDQQNEAGNNIKHHKDAFKRPANSNSKCMRVA
jgi:hypothetical protein